jgi:hypothetical protein
MGTTPETAPQQVAEDQEDSPIIMHVNIDPQNVLIAEKAVTYQEIALILQEHAVEKVGVSTAEKMVTKLRIAPIRKRKRSVLTVVKRVIYQESALNHQKYLEDLDLEPRNASIAVKVDTHQKTVRIREKSLLTWHASTAV